MNTAAVETWLQSFAGLDSAAVGGDTVSRAARARMAATGCATEADYLARLATSAEERTALIDQVVVPETWFFRDRPALDVLVGRAAQDWSRSHPGATFRVLSLPCATGEEPYSLVMAFALAGWPLERLRIDAIDISRRNLERAIHGEYARNSFRGADLAFRAAFLEPVGAERWRVKDRLRTPVSFAQGNLLADEFAAGRPPYDAIFCRNLLIYFDPATQARAVRTLDRLLAPGGWIAVGPSEPVLLMAHGFELLKVHGAFLLQRAGTARGGAERMGAGNSVPDSTRPAAALAPADPAGHGHDAAAGLAELQRLADAGRLAEAKRQGEELLERHGASAPVLFLLGVVAEGAGETARAEEFFRRTVYLEPGHSEALLHLAARAELEGDLPAARGWRERAQRALNAETG